MKKELRYYQSTALDALFLFWRTGGGNALIVLPTASGKSLVIAELCRYLLTEYPCMRILVVTHTKELVEQNYQELVEHWPDASVGLYSAGLDRRDAGHSITVAGVQSIFRKPDILGDIDLVLVDEAHLISPRSASMYGKLFAALRQRVPDMRIVGFTATPFRLDSGSLIEGKDRLFDNIVYEAKIPELMDAEFLSRARLVATKVGIDVGGVGIRQGEFITPELEQAAVAGDNVSQACAELVRLAAGKKSILVFCCGISHALALRDRLRELGVACETVRGDMEATERDRIVDEFRQGTIRCVTSVNVLSTGYNAPNVDCIVMMRPTLSAGLYIQQVGRGFRVAPGKNHFTVLDFAGNVKRHGPLDDPSIGKVEKDNDAKAKECAACGTLNAIQARTCAWCEEEFPDRGGRPHASQGREPKHFSHAEDGLLFAAHQKSLEPVKVTDWSFRRHEKSGKPDSLRVCYRAGLLGHYEWICFEHGGAPAWRAVRWWTQHGGNEPTPDTVMEALERIGELTMPSHIEIRPDGEFWRVIAHHFDAEAA